MIAENWLIWAGEHQNWFLGAMGVALIFYMGRGCISIISNQRIRQIEDRENATGRPATTGMPIWVAYALLILSTGIPAIIIITGVIIKIVGVISRYGIWVAIANVETIVFIIYIATGFLLGIIVWGVMRIVMWVVIKWFARLFHGQKLPQVKPQRKDKGLKAIQNLLMDSLRKGLIPDRRLEVAIREAIGKHKGRILKSDLEGLTELNANRRRVIDLSGIEYCTDLQKLNLYNNQLRIISPLSNLTNLYELVLTDGGIKNISPLRNLTKMQRLRLGSNFITDINPLRELVDLRELYLRGNQINSVGPLSNLTKIQELELGGNQIRSINPLSNLTNLRELVLTDNWINDITPLSNLTNLQKIYLGKNQIRDIRSLISNSGISKGAVVDLTDNPLNDAAYDIHIPILQERGAKVLFSPKL